MVETRRQQEAMVDVVEDKPIKALSKPKAQLVSEIDPILEKALLLPNNVTRSVRMMSTAMEHAKVRFEVIDENLSILLAEKNYTRPKKQKIEATTPFPIEQPNVKYNCGDHSRGDMVSCRYNTVTVEKWRRDICTANDAIAPCTREADFQNPCRVFQDS